VSEFETKRAGKRALASSSEIERVRANRRASEYEPTGGRASVKEFWRAPACSIKSEIVPANARATECKRV